MHTAAFHWIQFICLFCLMSFMFVQDLCYDVIIETLDILESLSFRDPEEGKVFTRTNTAAALIN